MVWVLTGLLFVPLREPTFRKAMERSFLCPQASAWVTWLDYKLKIRRCQDRRAALEELQSISSCWGAWVRIRGSSGFLCYGERKTHLPPKGGFDLFYLTICFLFSFSLMTITQILPLDLTPKAHPAGIPAFLNAEAGALLIPCSCAEESPNGQKPLRTFWAWPGEWKGKHYLSNNSIILKDSSRQTRTSILIHIFLELF